MRLAWIAALGLALGGTAAGAVASGQPVRSAEVGVSNLPGPQTNATSAVGPTNPDVLLAGSNSILEGTQRIYSSPDGGTTWRTSISVRPAADIRTSCPS